MEHDVWIPAVHRDLTDGVERVQLAGATVGALVEELDRRYPGIGARLCEDGQIRPHIAIAVDGIISYKGLRQRLEKPSEIHFIPAMSGG